MIKILHSADWHLDTSMQGKTQAQSSLLRSALLDIPDRISELCREEGCDLMLLSGDLFDGAYTQESYRRLYTALERAEVPVFITPGNHDFVSGTSPWLREVFPENVHIFKQPQIESVLLQDLSCRVYGAGFDSMDCPGLLQDFHAQGQQRYAIGIFHGDPVAKNSPYNPVTNRQVQESGLDYLALGHVHKNGDFRAGDTLCAWPGCPMGRGYDEQGEKGVYIVTLDTRAQVRFLPLKTPRFYDLETAGEDAHLHMRSILPPVGSEDFYRITLTGACEVPDVEALQARFPEFPNLTLRDRTTRPVALWGSAGEDTFEGIYFALLKKAVEAEDGDSEIALLAAKLSRQLLSGEEVSLP